MARFTTTIPTSRSVEDAFTFMADVRNFSSWDPGVERSTQILGLGPGPEAAYDLAVKVGPLTTTMRYEVSEWDTPRRLVLVSNTAILESVDEIRVEATPTGSTVTYDATLTLKGPLSVADGLLSSSFEKIGARADEGLRRALGADSVA